MSKHRSRILLCGILFSSVLLFFAGCDAVSSGSEDEIVGGVDLDVLFAPARTAEIEQVEADWADRDTPAAGIELVFEGRLTHVLAADWEAALRVFAHDMDGYTHYGAVITPTTDPDAQRNILLYLHGGDQGVDVSEVALALALTPDIRDDFLVVVPSFRYETLRTLGVTYTSEGPPSPWDRDVDDAIALVNVALETTPSANPHIVALGFSRGATVGLLAAARDARIVAAVGFFGPTDFLGPFARKITRDMLTDDLPDLPGISYLDQSLIEPLQYGEKTMDEVRLDLIRRSPVYFADRLPPLQIHHGLDDTVVPSSEARALADVLDAAGRTDDQFYFYEGGVHNPLTLDGALDRLSSFLERWILLPV